MVAILALHLHQYENTGADPRGGADGPGPPPPRKKRKGKERKGKERKGKKRKGKGKKEGLKHELGVDPGPSPIRI